MRELTAGENEKIEKHLLWLNSKKGGECADFSGHDFSGADLSRADLRRADLGGADFSGADLCGADLCGAYLRGANLSDAYLGGANLSDADLSNANLCGAYLGGAYLRDANLSGVKNLLSATDWLQNSFSKTTEGYIVYRSEKGRYGKPEDWEFIPGKYLTEVTNSDRCTVCGCGVNFATLEWIKKEHPNDKIWECLLYWEDLPDVCVPHNTDGKARCQRLQLVKIHVTD